MYRYWDCLNNDSSRIFAEEIYPNAINVVIQYKTPNFLTEKQFENVVEQSKKEMSPEYHIDGIWGTLPEEKYAIVVVITKAK